MIDWFGLASNALWVAGLALLLAAAGWWRFGGALAPGGTALGRSDGRQGHSTRQLASLGFLCFCLGLALTTTGWLAVIWLGLAAVWAGWMVQGPAGAQVRAWLSAGGWGVVGLILAGSLFVAAYSLVIRPWMQPDEPRHYEVVQHTARLARPVYYPDLVLDWEREIIADMETQEFWWYGYSLVGWDPQALPADFSAIWGDLNSRAFFQQPAYYVLVGGLLRQWWLGQPLSLQVLWLRLLGAVLFAAALCGVYVTGRELFPDRFDLHLTALALAALWPSHITTFATVNNDGMVELWVVWATYFGIRLIRRGVGRWNLTALALFGLLAILTKRSGLVVLVLPLALVLRVVAGGVQYHAGNRRRGLVWAILALVLAVLAVGGLWLAAERTGRIWAPPDFLRSLLNGDFLRQAAQAPLGRFAEVLLRTFVGWFGWLRVALPDAVYGAGLLFVIVGTAALLAGYAHIFWRGSGLERWQRGALLLLAALLFAQFILAVGKDIVYGFWQSGSAPQARYLYPVISALVLPAALGASAVLRGRWRRSVSMAVIALLTLFNLYVLVFVLYPFFWL